MKKVKSRRWGYCTVLLYCIAMHDHNMKVCISIIDELINIYLGFHITVMASSNLVDLYIIHPNLVRSIDYPLF